MNEYNVAYPGYTVESYEVLIWAHGCIVKTVVRNVQSRQVCRGRGGLAVGEGWGGWQWENGCSEVQGLFVGDGKVIPWTVLMVVQLCKYTKTH